MLDNFIGKIINADCMDILKQLPDKSIDLVLTDPPYLYTNCEFDKKGFDEEGIFAEFFRVLKDDRLLVFTGYGMSFYRWNCICEKCGFSFKENPVFNKISNTSPFQIVPRTHEQISILEKGKAKLRKLRIPYVDEMVKQEAFEILIQTCKRVNSLLNTNLKDAENYLKTHKIIYDKKYRRKFNVVCGKTTKYCDRGIASLRNLEEGKWQNSIFNIKSERTNNIHPTQKPIELFERIIKICSDENDLVLDCFSGSGTTAIACHRLQRRFICIEKDQEYWAKSCERLKSEQAKLQLF